MDKSKAHIYWFVTLLVLHLAHVIEEIFGKFRAIEVMGSLTIFILVNIILLSIPVVILVYLWKERRWALYAGMAYAIIMGINGLGHIIGYAVTGEYIGFFAGAVSGIGMILVAPPLIISLRRALRCRSGLTGLNRVGAD